MSLAVDAAREQENNETTGAVLNGLPNSVGGAANNPAATSEGGDVGSSPGAARRKRKYIENTSGNKRLDKRSSDLLQTPFRLV